MDICKLMRDNAASRATITVTPIANGMSAAAMLNDVYAHVCRAQGTSMTVTLVWPSPEIIGGAHEVWSNLSPTATQLVRGFSDPAGANKVLDTGVAPACPWPARKLGGLWTPATAASAYAYGGGSHARAWFPNVAVRRLDIELGDVDNLQGYIEVSRLFVGQAWEPSRNADYNPVLTPDGTGTPFRDGSGARRSTRGTKSRRLSVAFSYMDERDRAEMEDLQTVNGTEIPFVFSLYPNSPNTQLERDRQGYWGLVGRSGVRRPNFADHAITLDMETI
jgi:hypothetical protein